MSGVGPTDPLRFRRLAVASCLLPTQLCQDVFSPLEDPWHMGALSAGMVVFSRARAATRRPQPLGLRAGDGRPTSLHL